MTLRNRNMHTASTSTRNAGNSGSAKGTSKRTPAPSMLLNRRALRSVASGEHQQQQQQQQQLEEKQLLFGAAAQGKKVQAPISRLHAMTGDHGSIRVDAATVSSATSSTTSSTSSSSSSAGTFMDAVTTYCTRQSAPEPPLLAALRAATLDKYASSPGAARMLCDPLQGRVLGLLSSLCGSGGSGISSGGSVSSTSRVQRVLELGAFTGYSAISLALGLGEVNENNGNNQNEDKSIKSRASGRRTVLTCEPDAEAASIAQRFIQQGGLSGRIELRPVKAMEMISSLCEEQQQQQMQGGGSGDELLFDLVFIDADKKQYTLYLQALMGQSESYNDSKIEEDGAHEVTATTVAPSQSLSSSLLRDGALIVVDNTLWKGLVLGLVSFLRSYVWMN